MHPMRIADFALERYFARWEFAVDHLLCASDVQGMPMAELLDMADDETRALWDGLTLGYTESTGHPLLRREIAGLYERIEPDDVLVFAGAEEAIFCLANVLLGPGRPRGRDLARLPEPVRGGARGRRRRHAPRAPRGRRLVARRPAAARRRSTPTTRLVVVNAPHNPTGMLPTHDEWAELTGDARGARDPSPRRRGLPVPRVRRRATA